MIKKEVEMEMMDIQGEQGFRHQNVAMLDVPDEVFILDELDPPCD